MTLTTPSSVRTLSRGTPRDAYIALFSPRVDPLRSGRTLGKRRPLLPNPEGGCIRNTCWNSFRLPFRVQPPQRGDCRNWAPFFRKVTVMLLVLTGSNWTEAYRALFPGLIGSS